MACVNWKKIKAEYITDETASYRKLAEKYGVSRTQIYKHSKDEGWVELRRQKHEEIVSKTVDQITDRKVDRLVRLQDITDKLLDKLEQAVDELDKQLCKTVKKTKIIEYKNRERPDKPTKEVVDEVETLNEYITIIDRKGVQAIASALKDIKDVQMLKSELDAREQQARIANLERQAKANENDNDKPCGVVLIPAVLEELAPPIEPPPDAPADEEGVMNE